ncbi:MAG: 2-hydroxyacid dehydrogenase [Victivallales bacterium]|nr:2-hydroxyacid dehydrogenase [Victivallales bacterium]
MGKRIAFFDTKPYDKRSFEENNEGFGFEFGFFETHLESSTASLCEGFDGVCAFVNDTVDAEVIETLSRHKIGVVALRCAGYNNVDFQAAYGKVHVVRVPAYSPHAVAEHSVALMLSLNRKTHKAYQRTREGNFSINGLMGFDMHGRTAGVVGTGKIGQCMVSILLGFGLEVLAYDPNPTDIFDDAAGFRYCSLDELYAESDIISLHCPLTPDTTRMIDRETISNMKPGVMIINTGRGKLIDTDALIAGLKSGKIGSAGLDVYEEESEYFFEDKSAELINDDTLARLLTFHNVLVTSHQGFFTAEAIKNIAQTTLGNLKTFFDGGFIENEICYRCDGICRKKKGENCF